MRSRTVLLDVVRLLHTPLSVVFVLLLLASLLLPFLYDRSVPRPYGQGVVVETSPDSAEGIVRLANGSYTTVYGFDVGDGDAPPVASSVPVYKADWNGPSLSGGRAEGVLVAGFFGAVVLVVTGMLVAWVGDSVLTSLERRARRRLDRY